MSIIIIAILISSILCVVPVLATETFGIQTIICTPSWYCTAFTKDTCGTRDCVDAQGCGFTTNMPTEYIECPSSSGGSGGGSGSGGTIPLNTPSLPSTHRRYFTADTEFVKIDLPETGSGTRIIKIKSTQNETYHITVHYPSNYNQSKTFVINKQDTVQAIAGKITEIELFFNSTGIRAGTYILTTEISGSEYQKNISTIVTVDEKDTPTIAFDVKVDSDIRATSAGFALNVSIIVQSPIASKNNSISLMVIGPDGKVVSTKEYTFDAESRIRTSILLPPDLENGYYTLAAKISSREEKGIKNVQFTILSEKYHLIERPALINIPLPANQTISIVLGLIVVLFVAGIIGWRIISREVAEERPRKEQKRFRDSFKNIHQKKQYSEHERVTLIHTLFEQGFIGKSEEENLIAHKCIKQTQPAVVEEIESLTKKSEQENALIVKEKASENTPQEEIPILTPQVFHKKEPDIKPAPVLPLPPKPQISEPLHISEKEKERKRLLFERIIADEKAFYLKTGEVLHSIKDLKLHLEKNDLDTFNYHTAQGRNDFANWVGGVFGDIELASRIRESKSIIAVKKVIDEYVS